MARARRKPAAIMMPVAFIETAAQNAGCEVEIIEEEGKARRKRRFRLHELELMRKGRDGRPRISERQMLAGLRLHEAWCSTMLSPPAIQEVYVDAPPRPDDVAVAQVEAMQRYADVAGVVPRRIKPIVVRVACHGRRLEGPDMLSDAALLQVGLDLLANEFGY